MLAATLALFRLTEQLLTAALDHLRTAVAAEYFDALALIDGTARVFVVLSAR